MTTTTQECPKCGCFNRGCPNGGCFWDIATEEQLDKVIQEGLAHPNWRPTSKVMTLLMKTNKTRMDKLFLALAIDQVINTYDEDSEDEDSEDEE